jgi:hypothetical protein
MGWVVNATTRPLYPRESPGSHCIGGWVGPRACLDRQNNFLKMKFGPQPRLGCRSAFWHYYELVTECISLWIRNSQFLKIASSFYLGFAMERVKRRFLISDFSVGNITLCLGQPDAGELWVERASSKLCAISRIPFHTNSNACRLLSDYYKYFNP